MMGEAQNATVERETDLPDLEERESGLEARAALAGDTQEHRSELEEQGVILQNGKAAEFNAAVFKRLEKEYMKRCQGHRDASQGIAAGHIQAMMISVSRPRLCEVEQRDRLRLAVAADQFRGGLRRRSDADELNARGILLEESPATHEANRKTAAAALESALEHRPDAAEALSHDAPASSS